MGIAIKEALKIGGLKEGKIVAGHKGLNRIVNYVDILEVPDMLGWLKGEELILTTGYAIKDNPDMQEKLISELAKINAAGIVIKINRFWDKIPEIMIKKANELSFPIIQIPPDVPYIDITNPLLKEILLKQNEEKFMNKILKEILCNNIDDKTFIKRKLKSLSSNFDINTPIIMLVASYDDIQNLKKVVKIEELQYKKSILFGEISSHFVIICNVDDSLSETNELEKEVEELLFYSNSSTNKEIDNNIICVVSRVIKDFSTLQKEYLRLHNAINAIEIMKEIGELPIKNKLWYFYDEIVHYVFLYTVSTGDIVTDFIDYVLTPFKKIPEKDRELLMHTLYEYIRNGGNISKTSRDCFLHRNTLIYRMNKLKKILNTSFNSPDEMFKYYLAIIFYQFKIKKRK
ncbi:PucR family transcriptional regulator [Thermoanaerobacterium thermosaccharolyticum]|uniref:PucR family transcriptional regulator n=1 Tax=Thermoanaerobacterium thermosaccharolyticum TaxID=1517 RepID=UPI003DA8D05A